MSRVFVLVLMVLVLSACSMVYMSTGGPIDRTHVSEIKNGVQNKTQIATWFGEPSSKVSNYGIDEKGCVEKWTFEHKIFKMGKATHSEFLVVRFDKDGKVCDHTFSEEKLDK